MALNGLGLGFLFTAQDAASGVVRGLNSNIQNIGDQAEQSQQRVQKAMDGMAKGLRLMAAGSATMGAVAAPVAIAASFQKGMAEVHTLMDVGKADIEALGNETLTLAAKYGAGLGDATSALYNTVSASIAAEDAAKFMDQAFMASVAGVTDANTAVDALTTAVNGYQKDASWAAEASDLMFTAVKRGKTTFAELGSSIGDVIPTANSLGVGMDQLMGAYATMTKQGINTAKSTTLVKSALVAAMSKQDQAAKMGTKVAQAFSLQNLKAKGLQGWMRDVAEATGGSQEKLIKLVGSSEAASAILAMTGANAKTAAEDLAAVKDSAGATQDAYEKMSNTLAFQSDKAGASLKVLMVHVGKGLSEALVPFAKALNVVIGAVSEWAKNNPGIVKGILSVVAAIGAALFAVGFILFIKAAFMALAAVLPIVGSALLGIVTAAWPVVLVVAAIIGAVYLLKKAWDANLGGIQQTTKKIVNGIVAAFWFVVDAVKNVGEGIYDGFKEWVGPIVEPLQEAFGVLWTVIGSLVDKISTAFGSMGDEGSKGPSKLMLFFKAMGNVIGQVLGFLVTIIATVFSQWIKWIAFLIQMFITLGEGIGTFIGWLVVNIMKIPDWFADAWNSAVESVSSFIDSVVAFFSKAWNWIKSGVVNLATSIANVFSNMWEWVKNIFRQGAAFLLNAVAAPIRGWMNLISKIPGMGDIAKSVNSKIDSVISVVRGDSKAGTPEQTGGPTFAAKGPVGEAGASQAAEQTNAVISASREVDPNMLQQNKSIEALAAAMREQSKSGKEVVVQIDGETIARAVEKQGNESAERSFSPGD